MLRGLPFSNVLGLWSGHSNESFVRGCPGCTAYASGYQIAMTWCIDDICGHFYKVVNIIQEHIIKLSIYCILFYKLLSWLTSKLT